MKNIRLALIEREYNFLGFMHYLFASAFVSNVESIRQRLINVLFSYLHLFHITMVQYIVKIALFNSIIKISMQTTDKGLF